MERERERGRGRVKERERMSAHIEAVEREGEEMEGGRDGREGVRVKVGERKKGRGGLD